ncbi:MAG: sugar ABC transporter permease [Actinobacteria bacterium]|nr:MAG: sugar ABC transporter permease [Actinomycetota bacterium]RIK07124.1 MAG: glycerol-3-phosphate ABC transporter permease [Acidobacteriota bacterium]
MSTEVQAEAGEHAAPAPRRHRTSRRTREALVGYLFLVPSLVIFGAFFFYPFGRLIWLGLHQQNRTGTATRWVGIEQYGEVLGGEEFSQGLWHSVQYLIYTVPLGLVLGLLLAVAAHRRLKGIKIFQTIFASTVASSVAVASVIFFVLINPQVGKFGRVSWLDLENPDSALFAVSLSSVWQNLGLTFIIVLAGLQAIPDEIIEASILDGFGPVRRFFRVTVPLIAPTLLFLVVVLSIFALQAFAQIDILTQGGPAGSTETLVFKIFNLQQPAKQPIGSILAVGLFGVTMIVSLGQFMILERRVHYGN